MYISKYKSDIVIQSLQNYLHNIHNNTLYLITSIEKTITKQEGYISIIILMITIANNKIFSLDASGQLPWRINLLLLLLSKTRNNFLSHSSQK